MAVACHGVTWRVPTGVYLLYAKSDEIWRPSNIFGQHRLPTISNRNSNRMPRCVRLLESGPLR